MQSLVPVQFANNGVFAAQPTTSISLQGNLAAGASGRQTVALPYIDESGVSQTITLGFTGSGSSNSWGVDAVTSAGTTVALSVPSVAFDGNGNLISPSPGQLQATINDPAGPQNVNIDLAKLTQLAGQGGLTVQQVNQDGFIAGRLQNTYFTADGTLMGSYSNHEVKPLYKLPLASFANDRGLEALPGNVYAQTNDSGALTLNSVGNSVTSTQFVPGALELSTVDLSDQFSKMIVTQRAYSSASQIVKTADEMTQAVRDLLR